MPSLELLQIDLTENCPLSCGHCSNSSGPSKHTQFPFKNLIELLEQAAFMGVKAVVFSGGEPLCYPALGTAIKSARALGLNLTIFTTGIRDTRTREPIELGEWKSLQEDGLPSAGFSVYSAPDHREYHNQIVMLKPLKRDAFGANQTAMERAREAGIDIQAHFIPSDSTVADLQDIYNWAASLKSSVLHLQFPTRQGRNLSFPFLGLSRNQEQTLQRAVSSLMAVPTTTFHVSRLWLQRWSGSVSTCGASDRQLIVRADGTISPCNACKYSMPASDQENILEPPGNLITLWENSATLHAYRLAKATNSVCLRCQGIFAEYKLEEEQPLEGSALVPVVRADGVFP